MSDLCAEDFVLLKNTNLEYKVVETFAHFMGLEGGQKTFEKWAKLQDNNGNFAYWKVGQLEKIS